MEEFIFLLAFTFFLIFWFILLKFSSVKFLTISIPGITIILILIYQYFGFPILFFFLDEYKAVYIQDREIIWKMFLGSSYTITLIIIGFIFARASFGLLHLNNQYNPFLKIIVPNSAIQTFILLILFILSILVLGMYLSKVGLDNIAFLSAVGISETDVEARVLRSSMDNAFEGKYHRYSLFMSDFLSIVSVAFYGQWLIKKKLSSLTIFIISFIICFFSMVMTTAKSPVMWYLISLFFTHMIIKYQGRYKLKHLAIIIVLGLIFIGLMYKFFFSVSDFWIGIKYGISRTITGQMLSLHHYLIIFPDQVGYLGGKSFPNPMGIFPYDSISITKLVHSTIFPEMFNKGIVGTSPSFFWGEMYANFGYAGIFFPPFFVGYLLYLLNIIIFRLLTSPIVISIFIWMILHYRTLAGTSLSSFIIDTDMIIMIFLLMLLNAKGFKKTL